MDTPTVISLRREPGPLTRSLTALVLRLGLGMMFLIFGLGKLDALKTGEYPANVIKPFESETAKLPIVHRKLAGVELFATVLPYAEVGLGCALILGLLTPLTALLTGALLLQLVFGKLILKDIASMPGMLTYLLVDAAVLWLSPVTSNYFSLDGLIFGWFWRPRTEGEFHREISPQGLRY
jgi:uncharacterized membrane protein YphA (DoxX/SURF4 family)